MERNDLPTLLLADDEPQNLRTIIQILDNSDEEYNFITVPNGRLLVEIATKKRPDLIISDWDMPELNGIEAVQKLKENPLTSQIPVIMFTGVMISPDNLKQALQAGAADYVRKPVEATELLARINSMLQLSRSYQQIIRQKEELEKLNVMKNRILSVLSHDVRGPLNTLKGMLYLFENKAISEDELKQYLGSVNLQVENVSEFLENLLHWSKTQLKGISLTFEDLSLNKKIEDTLKILRPIATSKNISMKFDGKDDIRLIADRESIKIVIRNLISNAIKFSNENDVIKIETSQKDGFVAVCIEDTGVGISQENISKLFGVEELSTKGTKDEIGTGLGLVLCKQIIEGHSGKIHVESKDGKGSKFWFSLPQKQEVSSVSEM